MKISELFYTIQGEGRHVGVPAFFVRTALCNLHCKWCDTPYTWNFEGTRFPHRDNKKFDKDKEVKILSNEQIIYEIRKSGAKLVVFSGGEPMMQQDEINAIMKELFPMGYRFEVETNTTLKIKDENIYLKEAYFSCSPKLKSSGNEKVLRYRPEAIQQYKSFDSIFKFVVTDIESDVHEILEFLDENEIPHNRCYLMPEGITKDAQDEKSKEIINICKQLDFNFSPRLHILIYGNKRGT